MTIRFKDEEYRSPLCSIICLDEEADICVGTNQAGNGYDDDYDTNNLGDL